MSPRRIRPQLRKLTSKFHKPRKGDVFCFSFVEHEYYFGRVILDDLYLLGPKRMLLYFYNCISSEPKTIPELPLTKLLMNPIITTNDCWRLGYFLHLINKEIQSQEVLEKHCFNWVDFKKHVNEHGVEIVSIGEPCGDWALTTYTGIDLELQQAVGILPQWEKYTY
jgi:hypothetical protein